MSKTTKIPLEEILILEWKKGWPEYHVSPLDDYPAICRLQFQVAEYLKVEPSELSGHERCCKALTRIAYFCRNHRIFAARNLHFFDRAFQSIAHEMEAVKRFRNIKSNYYVYTKKSDTEGEGNSKEA